MQAKMTGKTRRKKRKKKRDEHEKKNSQYNNNSHNHNDNAIKPVSASRQLNLLFLPFIHLFLLSLPSSIQKSKYMLLAEKNGDIFYKAQALILERLFVYLKIFLFLRIVMCLKL